MKLKIKYILVALSLVSIATSCSKITPAGFWTNFQKDLITTKYSDQGPWGGYREIHWKSESENKFTLSDVVDFASKNGWQLTDSLTYTSDSLRPLTKYSDSDYSINILKENVITKINSTDNNIYVFKTGWIAFEPGNLSNTEKNGFVIINSNGTELVVYHLWGE